MASSAPVGTNVAVYMLCKGQPAFVRLIFFYSNCETKVYEKTVAGSDGCVFGRESPMTV